ncbi:N-6 DNA methylase [Sphingomonas montanisoli]|uniref:site-specific DNA-methyltransferase (adenine-specific) n=1 Tax=Sphingomonas montanisoli TaxID=2606412 RepID=A0A5D9CDT8_9SPHN|nr:N-6 DNA methylase [Sphingomonas montanisoli]TZG29140.1 N-6 DNA methylase [Sphingomonas montanisoli]
MKNLSLTQKIADGHSTVNGPGSDGDRPRAARHIPDWSAEERYMRAATIEHRKSLGQFFTPPRVAALMADWIAQASPRVIADPALGTGILTRAALKRCPDAKVVAFETDRQILLHSDVGIPTQVEVRNDDFLYADIETYDAVTMNPPYIRHRKLEGFEKARSAISVRAGFVIPKSANLYIYFVVKSCLSLRAGGRGAFLIPSEWLNANFSKSFKHYLLTEGGLRDIVLFSGCSNIFQDALTTASVLLVEKE